MALHSYPPKGYLGREMPLTHDLEGQFSLTAENETKNSVIIPLVFQDKSACVAATTFVNPKHASYEHAAYSNVLADSQVPQLQISFKCALSKLAIETDAIRSLSLNYMFINTAFLNRLDAADDASGDDIEGILNLTHETTDEQVYPVASTVDLLGGYTVPASHPANPAAVIESQAFDKEKFFDAMQYYTNKQMLRTVAPSLKTILLKRDYPYTMSGTRSMKPIAKYANPYQFCGILFHLPQVGQIDQYGLAADTTDIAHVDIKFKIRFNEWNKEFYQEKA